MMSKALVTMLAVSAMAMVILQSVEGGRDLALKEAKVHNPQIFNENLGYKSREEYDCDRYKYKDRDCYEYGGCDKSPYPDDGGDDQHGYNWESKQQAAPESKEVTGPGKYGVRHHFP